MSDHRFHTDTPDGCSRHRRQPGARRLFTNALATLFLALLVSGFYPKYVVAQSGSIPAPAESAGATASDAQEPGGVPAEVETLPRSMRPYWHVFLSFGLTWVLIGGYVYSMGQRFSRLEEELETLGGARREEL